MNGASNEGATLANLNASDGKRWSVARGYLRPVHGAAEPDSADRFAWQRGSTSRTDAAWR